MSEHNHTHIYRYIVAFELNNKAYYFYACVFCGKPLFLEAVKRKKKVPRTPERKKQKL